MRIAGARSLAVRALALALALLSAAAPGPAVAAHSAGRDPAGDAALLQAPRRGGGGATLPALKHSPFNAEASIQIAVRQKLFDYAVQEGLAILDAKIREVQIPEYRSTLNFPVIGGVDVGIMAINVTALDVPRPLTRVTIESGYYHVQAGNLTAQITFNWTWSKGPLSGAGYGDLSLQGGSLDAILLVRNQEAGVPQLVTVTSAVGFQSLDLRIHSFSVDWLYQALLYIFSGTIKRQIEEAVDSAVHTDVPNALNALLGTLPARLDIRGLPFSAVFTYAVYTLNYVVLKGYGEVEGGGEGTGVCPFATQPLPLTPGQIGVSPRMLSLYLHQSIPNCILWGLHSAGALRVDVQDGQLPQIRLITDLFGRLMPDLPKLYPKKGVQLSIAALEPPTVAFQGGEDGAVVVSARYATNVSVLDAAGEGAGPLLLAQLTANLTFAADFGWQATEIKQVSASYAIVAADTPVSLTGWCQIMEWVVKQAGPKQTLQQLWDTYVRTPVTPQLALADVAVAASGGWLTIDTDVTLDPPEPAPAPS